jgi:ribonuclease-3
VPAETPEAAGGRDDLETRIGHRFARGELLRLALTHRSFGASNNERLEFLGDAVLGFVIAGELYRLHPDLREGQLSRLRASLVRREALAAIARSLDLGEALHLAAGEAASGGRDRDSNLADALEAVLGAIQLDAGTAAAESAVRRWFGATLARLDPAVSHKDAKTELQEYLQARRRALPRYELLESGGEGDATHCRVLCYATGLADPAEGCGRNRRIAEQQAARAALERLAASGQPA